MKSFKADDYDKVIADDTLGPRELIVITNYSKEHPDAFYWICKEEWEKIREWEKEMEKKIGRYLWTGKHEQEEKNYIEEWKRHRRST